MTKFGDLDLLGEIGEADGYDELLPNTLEMEIADGVRVRVLDLKTVIRMKEIANREKDKAVLPVLRRTLEESQ